MRRKNALLLHTSEEKVLLCHDIALLTLRTTLVAAHLRAQLLPNCSLRFAYRRGVARGLQRMRKRHLVDEVGARVVKFLGRVAFGLLEREHGVRLMALRCDPHVVALFRCALDRGAELPDFRLRSGRVQILGR